MRAVFALPVSVATSWVGALDLFRNTPGPLSAEALSGGLWAAELSALPLLDLMTAEVDWSAAAEGGDGWSELASLARVEVYQATGMLMGHLDVEAASRRRGFAARERPLLLVASRCYPLRTVPPGMIFGLTGFLTRLPTSQAPDLRK